MASIRLSEAAFVGVSALLSAGSTTLTIVWCASMSAMGMPMPGGWTMSVAWMRMPSQTRPSTAASFLGMWVVMMMAMMLPSLGLRLGLHCSHCCAGLIAILLAGRVMDLRAMAVMAAAITVERLAPAGERIARAIGAVVVGAGFVLIARAAGPGDASASCT